MTRSPWTPLADATDALRFGSKATTLARVLGEGLPVVEGWVLPVETEPDVAALLDLPVSQWILRSSSPLEDRPGFSAAGLFRSVSASASQDELMRGLRTVLASARDPQLMALTGGEAPIAVLAQPHLDFETWCTAELRAGELFYEGWTDHGERRFASGSHPELDELAGAAAHGLGIDPALLELGIAEGKAWVLQIRTAPSRAPSRRPVPARPGPLHVGLGLRVHPGDEEREWRADL